MKKEKDKEKVYQTLAGAAELADYINEFFLQHEKLKTHFFTVMGYATALMMNRAAEIDGIDPDQMASSYCKFFSSVHNHVKEIISLSKNPKNLPN